MSARGIFLALLLAPATALAQSALRGKVSGEASLQSGNVERTHVILRAETAATDSLLEGIISGQFSYGEQNDVKADHSGILTADITLVPYRRLYPFVFGASEFNFARRLENRWQFGVGGGWLLLPGPEHRLKLSAAVMLDKSTFPSLVLESRRFSFRLKGHNMLFDGRLRFSHLSFFQPSVVDISDYRFRTLLTIDVPLTKTFSLRAAFEDNYESVVAGSRTQNDMRLSFGFSLLFE